jgi:hypothetical protein
MDGGVLIGGLDLPTNFASAWQALQRAGRKLLGHDRSAWLDAMSSLRSLCRWLESNFEACSVDELDKALRESTDVVARLAAELHASRPRLIRTPLRTDLRAAFSIQLGPDLRRSIAEALDDYERQHESTAGAALRRKVAAELQARIGVGLAVMELQPVDAAATPIVEENRELRAPLGCFIVRLNGSKTTNPRLEIRGVFDEVAPLFARYTPLWNSARRDPEDVLFSWLRRALVELAEHHGLDIVELCGPCEVNPNALARPRLGRHFVDVWSASPRSLSLRDAHMAWDAHAGPILHLPSRGRPVAVFSFASADIARDDYVSQLLLRTGFRDGPAASFEATDLPGAQRTMLDGAVLARLLATHGPERFEYWQGLALQHAWPSMVSMRRDDQLPLLVPRDSPLALEAALEGARQRTRRLVVAPADRQTWLADAMGRHFVVEAAVPFRRARHAWSGVGA